MLAILLGHGLYCDVLLEEVFDVSVLYADVGVVGD